MVLHSRLLEATKLDIAVFSFGQRKRPLWLLEKRMLPLKGSCSVDARSPETVFPQCFSVKNVCCVCDWSCLEAEKARLFSPTKPIVQQAHNRGNRVKHVRVSFSGLARVAKASNISDPVARTKFAVANRRETVAPSGHVGDRRESGSRHGSRTFAQASINSPNAASNDPVLVETAVDFNPGRRVGRATGHSR